MEDTANMKRENKLYSYKDQMADQELKHELERKKGKKAEAPKLSKKQQEAKAAQLNKESQIRNDLKTVRIIKEFIQVHTELFTIGSSWFNI